MEKLEEDADREDAMIRRAAAQTAREAMISAQRQVAQDLARAEAHVQATQDELSTAVQSLQEKVKRLTLRNTELERAQAEQHRAMSSVRESISAKFTRLRRSSVVGGVQNDAMLINAMKAELMAAEKKLADAIEREAQGAEKIKMTQNELRLQVSQSEKMKKKLDDEVKSHAQHSDALEKVRRESAKLKKRYETLKENHAALKNAHEELKVETSKLQDELHAHRAHRTDIDSRAAATLSRIRRGESVKTSNMSDTDLINMLQSELVAASHALESALRKEGAAKAREEEGVQRIAQIEKELALQTNICLDFKRKNQTLEASIKQMDVSHLQQTIDAQNRHLDFARRRYQDVARQLRDTNLILNETETELANTQHRERKAKLSAMENWLSPAKPNSMPRGSSSSPRQAGPHVTYNAT
eukprot:g68.t1